MISKPVYSSATTPDIGAVKDMGFTSISPGAYWTITCAESGPSCDAATLASARSKLIEKAAVATPNAMERRTINFFIRKPPDKNLCYLIKHCVSVREYQQKTQNPPFWGREAFLNFLERTWCKFFLCSMSSASLTTREITSEVKEGVRAPRRMCYRCGTAPDFPVITRRVTGFSPLRAAHPGGWRTSAWLCN